MIQRIQSIYLLLVVILMILTACMPLAMFLGQDGSVSSYYALGVDVVNVGRDTACYGVFAISLLAAILALATIFLFKNRPLQIRLTVLNILVLIGWYAAFIAFAFAMISKYQLEPVTFHCKVGAVLPLVAIILNLMAVKAIRKDERLVKAADRLR